MTQNSMPASQETGYDRERARQLGQALNAMAGTLNSLVVEVPRLTEAGGEPAGMLRLPLEDLFATIGDLAARTGMVEALGIRGD